MENVDIIDKVTTIYGDCIKFVPPFIGSRHNGRPLSLNRTEEIRDSNPLRSTLIPSYVGVYVFYPAYIELIRNIEAGMRSTMAR